MTFMSVCIVGLFLPLIVGCSTGDSPLTVESHNAKPTASANNSVAVVESHVERPTVNDEGSKTLDCADPKGYSVVEDGDAEANYVHIVQGDKVLKTIRLPTALERNGFGFRWAKKTKEGFEISIEYGSRYYYGKRFNFICKQHKFYLSKIIVDNFDKAHPEKWNTKVIRVKPNVPLEGFVITDFMNEGDVQKQKP